MFFATRRRKFRASINSPCHFSVFPFFLRFFVITIPRSDYAVSRRFCGKARERRVNRGEGRTFMSREEKARYTFSVSSRITREVYVDRQIGSFHYSRTGSTLRPAPPPAAQFIGRLHARRGCRGQLVLAA